MIELFSSYIRNIAIFIIFMTLIELVLPDSKYKAYINLVSGFLLLFIMLTPVQSMLQNVAVNIYKNPFDISLELDKSIMQKERAYYDKEQKGIIIAMYREQLVQQIEGLISTNGNFHFVGCEITLFEEDENFGEIARLQIEVEEKEREKSFIRIEKVSVKIGNEKTNDEGEESEKLKNLKKSILDFYNLSEANIYINVSSTR